MSEARAYAAACRSARQAGLRFTEDLDPEVLRIYVWRKGGAPILRAAGIAFVFLGLMQPQWVRETREPAEDVALVVVDQSESLGLAGRREAARATADAVAQRLAAEQGLDVRVRETRGGPDGTMITSVIEDALSDVSRDRIGGVIDGVVRLGKPHDELAEARVQGAVFQIAGKAKVVAAVHTGAGNHYAPVVLERDRMGARISRAHCGDEFAVTTEGAVKRSTVVILRNTKSTD